MSVLRNVLIAAGFMSLGAVSTIGLQAAARGSHGFGPRAHVQELIADLNLSDDQQSQVDEIKAMMRDHHKAGRSIRQDRRGEMIGMLQQDSLDSATIHAEIDARAAERLNFAHDMADELIALHATLDVGQKAILAERAEELSAKMEAHMEERQERRGRRGGR